MEQSDTENTQGQTSKNLPARASKGKAKKESSGADGANNKSKDQKKWSLRRHWKTASRAKQAKAVLAGIGTLTAISILGVYIWDHIQNQRDFKAEHAPLIIHVHPPDLLQTYTCTPLPSLQYNSSIVYMNFQTGNIDKTYKNIGNDTAYDVNGAFIGASAVIPVKRNRNSHSYDETLQMLLKDCGRTIRKVSLGAPVEPGVENTIHFVQMSGAVPPEVILNDLVTFEWETCTTYADRDGTRHGTCDIYLLTTRDVPNLPEAERISGTSELPCDGVARTGYFAPMIGGHCQN